MTHPEILAKVWDWLKEAALRRDFLIDERNSIRDQGILHILTSSCHLPIISFTTHPFGNLVAIDMYRRMPTDVLLLAKAKKEPCPRMFSGEIQTLTLPFFFETDQKMTPDLGDQIIERATSAGLLHDFALCKAMNEETKHK